jgi:hypothetical protein
VETGTEGHVVRCHVTKAPGVGRVVFIFGKKGEVWAGPADTSLVLVMSGLRPVLGVSVLRKSTRIWGHLPSVLFAVCVFY